MKNFKFDASLDDITEVEDFGLIPEGPYQATIVDAELKETNSGNTILTIKMDLKGTNKRSNDLKMWDKGGEGNIGDSFFLVDDLSHTSWRRFKRMVNRIRLDMKGKINFNTKQLIGKTCQVVVEHVEKEGKGDYAGRFFTKDVISFLGYYYDDEVVELEDEDSTENNNSFKEEEDKPLPF